MVGDWANTRFAFVYSKRQHMFETSLPRLPVFIRNNVFLIKGRQLRKACVEANSTPLVFKQHLLAKKLIICISKLCTRAKCTLFVFFSIFFWSLCNSSPLCNLNNLMTSSALVLADLICIYYKWDG